MSGVKTLNPKAEVMGRAGALYMTISASKGLLDVMKTNLGPKGTIKMLVGGAGGEWPSQDSSPGVTSTLWMCRRSSPAAV